MLVDKYAVIGNPIAHSKSPLIHAEFAHQTGQTMSYEAILAPIDGFDATVNALMAKGYKGLNVTVPFKFDALRFASGRGKVNVFAATAGASNTLIFDGVNGVVADNTDGVGLVNDITKNLKFDLRNKKVLVLGSGGATFGVLQPLAEANPALVVIANRTFTKAEEAARRLIEIVQASRSNVLSMAKRFEELDGMQFDLIINSTSAGLTDSVLPIPDSIFAQGCLAYDMMYGRETPFMAQARRNGAQVADGLGMLVEQAAEAFYLWRGVRPDTQPVMEKLRSLAK
ncbi:MAG: shikimate dehydrogenase [Methylotenera sp.]|uniref:shikimate dehydrogenase n=1 Tax=Methylotenera sp. TaxID=2051956 RepID=UPI000D408C50|nr:shikimate dehydrogenase [Methylotenera sp.]PPC80498.1 MAG: shikimate dehydrogenase [Methylotenera sp.]